MTKIYLSLGSNLGDKKKNLSKAIRYINDQVGHITNISAIYTTEPWGFDSNEYFLNMVVEALTNLSANEILMRLVNIEKKMGRVRDPHAGYVSRTIDVDILFYGNEIIKNQFLTIPHKHICKRKFILQPLSDIAPGFKHPELGKEIQQLLAECTDPSSVKPFYSL
ncbi:MAG: 2-amino-4-hydroxy-6-hydroxymethyldihydropteridine diphosphokinase [Prolixibacteraceae bacterium]|nr:2-amino-4-hydroxy-6-hydroxymethyldihydropteridine diphosphokinase [Prolixibacteraceae bacterium]